MPMSLRSTRSSGKKVSHQKSKATANMMSAPKKKASKATNGAGKSKRSALSMMDKEHKSQGVKK